MIDLTQIAALLDDVAEDEGISHEDGWTLMRTATAESMKHQLTTLQGELAHAQFDKDHYEWVKQRLKEKEADNARLREAWKQSWDCSRDPGHTIMQRALSVE